MREYVSARIRDSCGRVMGAGSAHLAKAENLKPKMQSHSVKFKARRNKNRVDTHLCGDKFWFDEKDGIGYCCARNADLGHQFVGGYYVDDNHPNVPCHLGAGTDYCLMDRDRNRTDTYSEFCWRNRTILWKCGKRQAVSK